MAVYVDGMMSCLPNAKWRWSEACHLFADSLVELHDFAKKLGMHRNWFQDHTDLPHYDLTRNKRAQAVKLGAIEATREQLVEKMRERRKDVLRLHGPVP
jgi:hypothetical protein